MGIRRFQGESERSQAGTRPLRLGAQYFPRRSAKPVFTKALFLIAVFGCLYFARDFFMPLFLGLLFALILSPAVHALARRRIPTAAGAAIVLLSFIGLLALGGYFLVGPVSDGIRKGPQIIERISAKFRTITQPIYNLKGKTRNPEAPEVDKQSSLAPVKSSGALQLLATRAGSFMTLAGTTFILVYFLLAAGDALFSAVLAGISDPRRREQTTTVAHEIKRHISKYLLAITMINVAEGALLAGGLALARMPTPGLWGAMHAVLNFIPYIGSITGLVIVALVSLVSFYTLSRAAIAPAIYLAIMILDNFASPLVLGKRLILNSALVFVSLMFWGWMWGIVGILLAIPLLMAVKIICDHVPNLKRYGRIISGDSVTASGTSASAGT